MDKQRELVPLEAIETGQSVVAQKDKRDSQDKQEEAELSSRQKRAEIGAIERHYPPASADKAEAPGSL